MKIIEPKVELWQQGDDSKAHVARCARVCYGRETGNDEATIKRLINDEHWSMFRHRTYLMNGAILLIYVIMVLLVSLIQMPNLLLE